MLQNVLEPVSMLNSSSLYHDTTVATSAADSKSRALAELNGTDDETPTTNTSNISASQKSGTFAAKVGDRGTATVSGDPDVATRAVDANGKGVLLIRDARLPCATQIWYKQQNAADYR